MRVFLASASDEIPDKQGRITIPAGLRDWPGLTHECTVIGADDRLEIWDTARWTAYVEANERPSPTGPRRSSQGSSDPDASVRPGLQPLAPTRLPPTPGTSGWGPGRTGAAPEATDDDQSR